MILHTESKLLYNAAVSIILTGSHSGSVRVRHQIQFFIDLPACCQLNVVKVGLAGCLTAEFLALDGMALENQLQLYAALAIYLIYHTLPLTKQV